ncbi:2-C-methyl-D-erythritol 4-phosphate cytidylyltransferase [Parafrankia irregularis]|uniref:2-C-methyl-D-erythritol 4-phosphate cytidylyltransferase n=1 Tax=Parafrankia irregularis TaxID=795642 RepID=A0A0S4QV73_9ACTN|nr:MULTISPECIES: 2-C-methyl-D-erythritol 4-phosphate cytidylyltransferase [Parafrankia]MBE3205050.1 2-C-methyl-D-erythritol 4-phosphate cytidylyltransferase [Parafrankia sp. CH37]CUU58728.1 2-C-methyl-D-erythritol 4-phosphate cytidylyltransferase [Parafrankia irregularis]
MDVVTPTTGRAGSADPSGPAWAIVLAAGGGTRFGGPKQFADLGGRPLVAHPVRAAGLACDGVVVVLPQHLLERWTPPAGVLAVPGGAMRADSVRAGLAAVPADAEVIVVTDAAHPLATPALYRAVVAAVRAGADGAVPGLPLTEVVKEVVPQVGAGGRTDLVAGASLPRETHRLVQTPHAFRASALRAVHADATEAVEDSAMVADAGGRIVVLDGEPANIHVTTPEELDLARLLLKHVQDEGEPDEHSAARLSAV